MFYLGSKRKKWNVTLTRILNQWEQADTDLSFIINIKTSGSLTHGNGDRSTVM